MLITFTDAEQRFADSAEGQRDLDRVRRSHDAREAHKGRSARPWTDAMEASAVRDLATRSARSRVGTAAMIADSARQVPIAQAEAIADRVVRTEAIRTAYRGR